MVGLNLQEDEGIVLQTTLADFDDSIKGTLDEIILTNKSIICVVRKSIGLFKRTTETLQFPLSSIKIIEGKAQIQQVDEGDSDPYLQILFKDGRRLALIFEDYEIQSPKWMQAINTAVSESKTPFAEKHKIEEKSENNIKNEDVQIEAKVSQDVQRVTGPVFCINCGTRNMADAKFCQQCGTQLGTVNGSTSVQQLQGVKQIFPDATSTKAECIDPNNSNNSQYNWEYNKRIRKCPNCGEILSHSAANCPACGFEL